MKSPAEKNVGYFVVIIVVAFVVNFVIAAIIGAVTLSLAAGAVLAGATAFMH